MSKKPGKDKQTQNKKAIWLSQFLSTKCSQNAIKDKPTKPQMCIVINPDTVIYFSQISQQFLVYMNLPDQTLAGYIN